MSSNNTEVTVGEKVLKAIQGHEVLQISGNMQTLDNLFENQLKISIQNDKNSSLRRKNKM